MARNLFCHIDFDRVVSLFCLNILAGAYTYIWAPLLKGDHMGLKSIINTGMDESGFGLKIFWICHDRSVSEIYYDIDKALFINRWLHEHEHRRNDFIGRPEIVSLTGDISYPFG